jgi:hypothetical protein
LGVPVSESNQTKKDRNVLGCLLGCFGICVFLTLALAGGVYYIFRFGPLAAAPPVDTIARLGGGPALILRVDAEAPGAFSLGLLNEPGLNAYNGAMIRLVRPYEIALQMEPAADGSVVAFGAALSTPRGTNVLLEMLKEPRRGFERNGREVSVLDIDSENSGVILGRGTLPLPVEAWALRGEAWPETLPGDAPTVERGHFIEFTLDNRNGGGGIAMTVLAQMMSEEPGGNAASPLSLLSQVRLIKGSRLVRTAWAAMDFTPAGDVTIKYRVSAVNEVCAILLAGTLAQAPDGIRNQMLAVGATVPLQISPSQSREGTEIQGEISIIGVAPAMREALLEFNTNRGDDPFGMMPLPEDESARTSLNGP